MEFNSRLKGRITQSLIQCLLEDAGLSIVPLGIEELVREVKSLTQLQYFAAGLNRNLRTLPDFIVLNEEKNQNWLLEVKYRKKWDEKTRSSVFADVEEQVAVWQPLYLAIFLGQAANQNDTPASFVRLARLTMNQGNVCHLIPGYKDSFTDTLVPDRHIPWKNLNWNDLPRLQDIFPVLANTEQFERSTLKKAITLIRQLQSLDMFEG